MQLEGRRVVEPIGALRLERNIQCGLLGLTAFNVRDRGSTSCTHVLVGATDDVARLFDVETCLETGSCETMTYSENDEGENWVWRVLYVRQANAAVTLTGMGRFRVYDLETGVHRETKSLLHGDRQIYSGCLGNVAELDQTIILGDEEGTISVWDLRELRETIASFDFDYVPDRDSFDYGFHFRSVSLNRSATNDHLIVQRLANGHVVVWDDRDSTMPVSDFEMHASSENDLGWDIAASCIEIEANVFCSSGDNDAILWNLQGKKFVELKHENSEYWGPFCVIGEWAFREGVSAGILKWIEESTEERIQFLREGEGNFAFWTATLIVCRLELFGFRSFLEKLK